MHIRSILRALSLAALVGAAACESGTEPSPPGEFRGTWGEQPFVGDAWAGIVNDSLYIGGSSPAGALSGPQVSIAVGDFRGPGNYLLGARGAEIRYVEGGDGIWATYGTTQPAAGTLVVTAVSGARVIGHVDFVADALPGHTPAGTRARFAGEFSARVQLPRLPTR